MFFPTLLAWLAHAYTALGLVRGGDDAFRLSFVLMAVATLVDSTDGWFARRVRVSERTPGFDGRRLDDLIDFQTYTCLPLLLVWRAGLLDPHPAAWLLVPLVASAYGFCQVEAKTEDHYFLGFPSYWNIVALYLYLLRLPGSWTLGVLVFFALLTFVPARYLYPSQPGPGNRFVIGFGAVWALAVLAIFWLWHEAPRALVVASLGFPTYYVIASWMVSVRHWRTHGFGVD
jgi:phosphatidylcholine synthase